MILTVIYGAYELLIAKQVKKARLRVMGPAIARPAVSPGATMTTNRLINDVSRALTDDAKIKAEEYTARRAEEEWRRDPFSESSLSTAAGTTATAGPDTEADLAYNGYLEIGKKRIAIINGVDYRRGDMLEVGRYKVTDIGRSSVTVVDAKGKKVTVPFLEE